MKSFVKVKLALMHSVITVGIVTLATLLSFLFRYIGLHESNFIMAYILGVLLVAKHTVGYFYGIVASVFGVMTFNFFFTEPYYTFRTYRPDYPVTFLVMLIVAVITSALTTKAKQEAKISNLREKRAQTLYQFSRSLLKVRSITQIAEVGVSDLAEMFNRPVIVAMIQSSNSLGKPYVYVPNQDERTDIFKSYQEIRVMEEAFAKGRPMGAGTEDFSDSRAYYVPVKGQSGILGVLGVSCLDQLLLSGEQKTLLEAAATQMALAVERERLWERQRKSKMEVERERLRGNLLRAISHDLRTPLTGILGATAAMLDHGDALDKDVTTKLLQGVYEDASWLIHSVENILSITKIDEGRIELKKSMEAVEEIVAAAASRIRNLAVHHTIKIDIPEELIMLPMDGILIEQVLVNLLDNAVKYTLYGSVIEISVRQAHDKVVFEVADNGNGIEEEHLSLVFNRFFTSGSVHNSGRRGTGLGLAICKSIISAHGGDISAFNNPAGGATFRFELPAKEG